MKSVATAVCSQARKSDSVRNSNCKVVCVQFGKKTRRCPPLLKFSILWCHKPFWYHVTHWSLKLTPFASLACSAGLLCPRRNLIQTVSMSPYIYLSIHSEGGQEPTSHYRLIINYQLIHYVHLINGCSKTLASFNSHVSVIFVCNPTAVESCLAHNLCFSDVKITKKQLSDG